jgi:hypothetical protein
MFSEDGVCDEVISASLFQLKDGADALTRTGGLHDVNVAL